MRTVLVTGGTGGLGRELASRLSSGGYRVFLHGRDPDTTRELARRVGATAFVADLASLREVQRLVDEVKGATGRLDVLVNNAGVGFGAPGGSRELSRDGLELRFAVNYLAPVLLTRELMPLTGKVVNVGSAGQAPPDLDDLNFEHGYDGVEAYRRSKLALAAFTFDIADEVTANVLHPATLMPTAMVHEAERSPVDSLEQGTNATLRLITEDVGTGQYFDGEKATSARPQAYDKEFRRRLREATDRILRTTLAS